MLMLIIEIIATLFIGTLVLGNIFPGSPFGTIATTLHAQFNSKADEYAKKNRVARATLKIKQAKERLEQAKSKQDKLFGTLNGKARPALEKLNQDVQQITYAIQSAPETTPQEKLLDWTKKRNDLLEDQAKAQAHVTMLTNGIQALSSEIGSADKEIREVSEFVEEHSDNIQLVKELTELKELAGNFRSADSGLSQIREELTVDLETEKATLNRITAEQGSAATDDDWRNVGNSNTDAALLAELNKLRGVNQSSGVLIEHDAQPLDRV